MEPYFLEEDTLFLPPTSWERVKSITIIPETRPCETGREISAPFPRTTLSPQTSKLQLSKGKVKVSPPDAALSHTPLPQTVRAGRGTAIRRWGRPGTRPPGAGDTAVRRSPPA